MMEYVDNYITLELIQIVVNQTNLYTQQQIRQCQDPLLNMHEVNNGNL
jgi:hypothetical protein